MTEYIITSRQAKELHELHHLGSDQKRTYRSARHKLTAPEAPMNMSVLIEGSRSAWIAYPGTAGLPVWVASLKPAQARGYCAENATERRDG